MYLKINVGIIGTGVIGPAHIEALRRLEFVNVDPCCCGLMTAIKGVSMFLYEGARVMSVVDAILQSHRQQRWVKV